jgi:AcrR family transcriptional regulator
MARTINATAHAVRRDAFIDVAMRLMQTKGWEQTSIQDLLDELDASRGAFYHYFDSKGALLEAVVARIIDGALASAEPIVADPAVSAPDKLSGLFGGIANWKNARQELLLSLMEIWLSEDNAIVREKFRDQVARRLTPLVSQVLAQGLAEGTFSASPPDQVARVFMSLLLSLNEIAGRLFIARQQRLITYEEVRLTLIAYLEGFERIVGARPGSLALMDEATLHLWFD